MISFVLFKLHTNYAMLTLSLQSPHGIVHFYPLECFSLSMMQKNSRHIKNWSSAPKTDAQMIGFDAAVHVLSFR
mgnify:CR=1 FL=1